MAGRKLTVFELLKKRHPDIEAKELYARILCGEIAVNGEKLRDPGARVSSSSSLAFIGRAKFVSRGGEKLEAALEALRLQAQGLVFIDAGSSTGGFTDCLLQRGARLVYAVDVGRGLLSYRLRMDPRVVAREGTNIMSVVPNLLDPPPEAAVADLSFRSIRRAASHLVKNTTLGWLLALIKPQFEWRPPESDFRGVVREGRRHAVILEALIDDLWLEGAFVSGCALSPLRGRKGNLEFFFLMTREQRKEKQAVKAELAALIGEARP